MVSPKHKKKEGPPKRTHPSASCPLFAWHEGSSLRETSDLWAIGPFDRAWLKRFCFMGGKGREENIDVKP